MSLAPFLLPAFLCGFAQESSPPPTAVLIRADKVIVRPGVVEEDSAVLVEGGRIIAVGRGLEAPAGARELRGKVVCAGFIDPWSAFGLDSDAGVDERTNAATYSVDAWDPYIDPRVRRDVLRAGVTSLRLQAGGVSKAGGVGVVVRNHPELLDRRAVVLRDACLSLALGISREEGRGIDLFDRVGDVDRALSSLGDGLSYLQDKIEYKHELEAWQKAIAEKEKELDEGFKKAKKDREKEEADAKAKGKEFKEKSYKEDKKPKPPRFDEDKEMLARAVDGVLPTVVVAHRALELRALLDGTEKFDRMRLVVAGGSEAFAVADELKERRIPVIVAPSLLGTERPKELENADPGLAARLHEAGVRVLLGSGGGDPLATRELPLLAALAVGYGLPRDVALDSITLSAARALDVADRLGSVEVGKDADLLVLDGEPLVGTTRVLYVLSNGDVVVAPEE